MSDPQQPPEPDYHADRQQQEEPDYHADRQQQEERAKDYRPKNELWPALAKFQAKACVCGKDSKGHGYTYASFDHVLTMTRKALLECGLIVVQPVECDGERQHVRTIVCHADSGDYIESTYALDLVQLKAANNAQQMGAAISYARRYAFLAALGLAAGGEDTDAADIAPETPEQAQAREQRAKLEAGLTAQRDEILKGLSEDQKNEARPLCKGKSLVDQVAILREVAEGGDA
jgi:hypothetical protein